jgi:hypothetical protein
MEERLREYSKVIQVVTELMDVTSQEIMGRSRIPEVVDARWMVIKLMQERGYTARQISPLINHPKRTVNHALSEFNERIKYGGSHLSNMLAIARQQLQ